MPGEKFEKPKGAIPSEDISGWDETLRKAGLSEKEINSIIGATNPEYAVRQNDPKGILAQRAERIISNSKTIIRLRKLTLPQEKEADLRRLVYGYVQDTMQGEMDDAEMQKRVLDFVSRL